jgi:hypothetical protein
MLKWFRQLDLMGNIVLFGRTRLEIQDGNKRIMLHFNIQHSCVIYQQWYSTFLVLVCPGVIYPQLCTPKIVGV